MRDPILVHPDALTSSSTKTLVAVFWAFLPIPMGELEVLAEPAALAVPEAVRVEWVDSAT